MTSAEASYAHRCMRVAHASLGVCVLRLGTLLHYHGNSNIAMAMLPVIHYVRCARVWVRVYANVCIGNCYRVHAGHRLCRVLARCYFDCAIDEMHALEYSSGFIVHVVLYNLRAYSNTDGHQVCMHG
jgi:hypothetical protein